MNHHALEIRSKPTIPDFFSPPQKKRAPKETVSKAVKNLITHGVPVVNPMANCLEISSTWIAKIDLRRMDFLLTSKFHQSDWKKQRDGLQYLKYITYPYKIYDLYIYIYYLYVYIYIYNLYVYIYIIYTHVHIYIYIYTFIQFLGVLGLSPNFGTFDSPNPLDRKSPSNWPVSCIADSFI